MSNNYQAYAGRTAPMEEARHSMEPMAVVQFIQGENVVNHPVSCNRTAPMEEARYSMTPMAIAQLIQGANAIDDLAAGGVVNNLLPHNHLDPTRVIAAGG